MKYVKVPDKINDLECHERGVAMLEACLVAPILVTLFLFLVDFTIVSKAQTLVSQVTRDAAIYLATQPSTLTNGVAYSGLQSSGSQLAACHAAPYESDCGHYITQQRVFFMLETQFNNHLDDSSFWVTTTRSGDQVTVQVSANVEGVFFMDGMSVGRNAQLRIVGSTT